MTQRRIVCAAVRCDGEIVVGPRHYDPIMREQIADRADPDRWRSRDTAEQGFIDQFGVFVSREEAYEIAEAAGQIIRPLESDSARRLYSEHLY